MNLDNTEFHSVGDIVFVYEAFSTRNGAVTTLRAMGSPLHTNMSHEPRLRGWCGETDNVSRTACGVGVVTKCFANDRMAVRMFARGSREESEALASVGWSELAAHEVAT